MDTNRQQKSIASYRGIAVALFLLSICLLPGCMEAYVSMETRSINGKPYVLLQTDGIEGEPPYFSVYTPHGNNLDDWDTVVSNLIGPVYGAYCQKGAQTEQLGFFHLRRSSVLDFSVQPPALKIDTLPFDWPAETAVELNGKTYAFGVDISDAAPSTEDVVLEGTLKAARFDGKKWETILADGPKVQIRKGNIGFSLQAVTCADGIKVLWREAERDQAFSADIEGHRAITSGPMMMASFDGTTFDSAAQTINGLPRGNTTAWIGGDGNIQVLIQSRKKLEEGISTNGPMEMWELTPKGVVNQLEVLKDSQSKAGLLPFIAAEHFVLDGQDYILRSNWQTFEIWQKTPLGWIRELRNPHGLPVYDLESGMLSALAIGLGLIALGAALAYHRRKHAWTILRKVRAHEVYASLGLRTGAYAVDLGLMLAATELLARLQGWTYVSPVDMLHPDLRLPYMPFFAIYVVYLAGTEWLCGATLGKFIMGLRVVMDNGKRLTPWAAVVRNFIGFFERMPLIVAWVTMPMILLGPRRQRLGDMLSRTYVVHKGALEIFKAQHAAERERRTSEAAANPSQARVGVGIAGTKGASGPSGASGEEKKKE